MKIKRLQTPKSFVIRDFIPNHEELFNLLRKDIPWEVMAWSFNHNLPRKTCHGINTPKSIQEKMDKLLFSIVQDINKHRHLISSDLPMLKPEKYGFFCNYYETEKDYTPFHEDNYGGPVISLSFGASREFQFKNKITGEISIFSEFRVKFTNYIKNNTDDKKKRQKSFV